VPRWAFEDRGWRAPGGAKTQAAGVPLLADLRASARALAAAGAMDTAARGAQLHKAKATRFAARATLAARCVLDARCVLGLERLFDEAAAYVGEQQPQQQWEHRLMHYEEEEQQFIDLSRRLRELVARAVVGLPPGWRAEDNADTTQDGADARGKLQAHLQAEGGGGGSGGGTLRQRGTLRHRARRVQHIVATTAIRRVPVLYRAIVALAMLMAWGLMSNAKMLAKHGGQMPGLQLRGASSKLWASSVCTSGFPLDLGTRQYVGLSSVGDADTQDKCCDACAGDDNCLLWNWCDKDSPCAAFAGGCFTGKSNLPFQDWPASEGFLARSRAPSTPHPNFNYDHSLKK
jgi:hypothetical protein